MDLEEIRKSLKAAANEKVKLSFEKFVPSGKKMSGVKVSVLNNIAGKIKEIDFDLVEKLWGNGVFEEQLLAVKILGNFANQDPERTIKLVEKFSKNISDWAICDALAIQGIRKIAKDKQKEIFALSKKYISSKNLWQRRFAIILLIELSRVGFDKKQIKKLSEKVRGDKEMYIKKAIIWLDKELNKYY
ncbi:MAG: DNA alkylation repair protein [Candidatus Pacebacteria bacterium]|nr:DNA alkylation repair protein [Candidatus Paceibacterota bacterium]